MTATLIVSAEELAGSTVTIEEGPYRHLFRARRLAVGDPIRLVDGQGAARHGRVESVERHRAILAVGESAATREASTVVSLFVAVPKGDRASWLVEKAVEVGVGKIVFVGFSRSVRAPNEAQIDRFRRVARSAVEQCGRARIPEIQGPVDLETALDRFRGRGFLLDPSVTATAHWTSLDETQSVGLFVGPEGGLEAAETELLLGTGLRAVSLGQRVLRTETAAILAIGTLLLAE